MFIAIIESSNGTEYVGKGNSLKNAYNNLRGVVSDNGEEFDDDEDEDIEFFEAEKIQVEFIITRKEVITSTPKVLAPRADPRVNRSKT